jgi:DNA-directed RNA polymerase specialized sigma24 family protein/ribosome-associated translation inhibitor RaiA
MNVHISFKAAKHHTVEHEIQSQVEKLRGRLQVFRPDLVHLKGVVEQGAGVEGIAVTLNLRLPTGQMAARGSNAKAIAAVKTAFEELRQQLNRHKELLRDYRRVRGGKGVNGHAVPFEETLAAAHLPEAISARDITLYVNTSLPRLRQFVERELAFREADGIITGDSIAPEEVLDETVLAALSDGHERPKKLAIEPWLYGLALRAIEILASSASSDGAAENFVPLEKSARTPSVLTNESQMQFHQPDELLQEEDVVADCHAVSPEEFCSSQEWLALTESALRDLPRSEREAFLLLAVEGFTVDEAAAITGRNHDDIRHATAEAQRRLRKMVPNAMLHDDRRSQSTKRAS